MEIWRPVFVGDFGKFFVVVAIVFKIVFEELDFLFEKGLRRTEAIGAAEGALEHSNPSCRVLI